MTPSTDYLPNHLSSRLQLVADLVPASRRLLDIGTDHAWLPIELVRRGCCQTAMAIDIRPGPLAAAERHIREAGLQGHIQTRLADGLAGLTLEKDDTVVLAGMGGYEMMEILGNEPRTCQAIILQPMKSLPELRRWLSENGYGIEMERLAAEKHHVYVVLRCIYHACRKPISDIAALVGPGLLADPNQPGMAAYLDKLLSRLHKQSRGAPELMNALQQISALREQLPALPKP